MKKFNVKPMAFANKIGVSYSTLFNYMRGECVPSDEVAQLIEMCTMGYVRAEELVLKRTLKKQRTRKNRKRRRKYLYKKRREELLKAKEEKKL
jgi:DNA-binding transcriptional regulator YdaS (Cro superfamily)